MQAVAGPATALAPSVACCRKGHPQTEENVGTFRLKSGRIKKYCHVCRDERAGYGGARTCSDCGVRFRRGGTSPRCDGCQRLYIDERESRVSGRKEHARPDAPYEIARKQVEAIYGIPSCEWINTKLHPLNCLHYARMISIYNSRKLGPPIAVTPRGPWSLMGAFERVKQAGIKPRRKAA